MTKKATEGQVKGRKACMIYNFLKFLQPNLKTCLYMKLVSITSKITIVYPVKKNTAKTLIFVFDVYHQYIWKTWSTIEEFGEEKGEFEWNLR